MAKKLTAKQQRFIDELPKQKFSVKKAAKKADISYDYARQLLTKSHIQKVIHQRRQKISEKSGVTTERVMREYERIAFFDPRKLFDGNNNLINVKDLDEDEARAIGSIEHYTEFLDKGKKEKGKEGQKGQKRKKEIMIGKTTKIKLIDKKGALDSCSKIIGIFTENPERSAKGKLQLDEFLDGLPDE